MGNIIGMVDSKGTPKLLTPWSLMHFVTGILLYGLLDKFIPGSNSEKYSVFISMFLHTLYEIKDYQYTYFNKPLPDPIHNLVKSFYKLTNPNTQLSGNEDTLLNSIGDTLSFCLGIYLYHKYKLNLKTVAVVFILVTVYFINSDFD